MTKSTSPLLPKWKTNQIFTAIQGFGLDPKDFDFKNADTEVRLEHKWSKSHFIFGGNASKYFGRYVIGDGQDWAYEVYSWESVMERVINWLRDVKLDLDTPDFWAELEGKAELLGGASDKADANTPFTQEEQNDIERRLRAVGAHVRRTYSLPEPEMEILNAKIDYLVNAAGRLGRIDWRNAFVGAIVGYIFTAVLPPESARSIFLTFMTVLRAIGYLFGHELPELPSG